MVKESLANERCVADLARAKKVILKLKTTNELLDTECLANYQDVETLKAQLWLKMILLQQANEEHAVLEREVTTLS